MNSVLLGLGKAGAFIRNRILPYMLKTGMPVSDGGHLTYLLDDADTFESIRDISCLIDCERSLTTIKYQTRHAEVLKTHVLNFVLGICFALPAH